jgi:hypothetical protein
LREETNQSEWRQGKEERRNSTKKEKGTRATIMSEVREFLLIGSLRRETEGIMKYNQIFDDPVLASKCMDSDFDDSLVAREALASPFEHLIYSL